MKKFKLLLLSLLITTIINAQRGVKSLEIKEVNEVSSVGLDLKMMVWDSINNRAVKYANLSDIATLIGGGYGGGLQDLQSVLDEGETAIDGNNRTRIIPGAFLVDNISENQGVKITYNSIIFGDSNGVADISTYIQRNQVSIGNGTRYANLLSTNLLSNRNIQFPNAPNQNMTLPVSFTDGTNTVYSDVNGLVPLDGLNLGGSSMTDAEVKTALENNADTNTVTDAQLTDIATISAKQNQLTAGSNITIVGDVISASISGGVSDITVVENVTELRAFTVAPSDGDLFHIKGHTVEGIGDGLIKWVNSSTETDNNGTYFKATTITTGRFIRVLDCANEVDIEMFGGYASSTFESTPAYDNALDYLVSIGGGQLLFPFRGDDYFIVTEAQYLTRDYSNIVIKGSGKNRTKIFIDSSGYQQTTGRGVFVNIGSGTDGLTIENLDVLVDEAAIQNAFVYGFVCSQVGDFKNIKVTNVKFRNEAKADSELGVTFFNLYRDVLDTNDTDFVENVTIKDNDVAIYGNSIYGIHTLRKVIGASIKNNIIELKAYVGASQSYNAIGWYGDSERFIIKENILVSSGHAPIGASMCRFSVISDNWVYATSDANSNTETGIEIERKATHGSTGNGSNSMDVHGNHVFNCPTGIWVTHRGTDIAGNNTKDIWIHHNFIYDYIYSGIKVSSSNSPNPASVGVISNVVIESNTISKTGTTGSGVYIEQAENVKALNNTISGGAIGVLVGSSDPSKNPTGYLKINNNSISNVTYGIHVRSMNCYLDTSFNTITNLLTGGRGVFILGAQGGYWDAKYNDIDGNNVANDGLRQSNFGTVLVDSKIIGNRLTNFVTRGIHIGSDNGTFRDNTSINCTYTNNISGTQIIDDNNKYL